MEVGVVENTLLWMLVNTNTFILGVLINTGTLLVNISTLLVSICTLLVNTACVVAKHRMVAPCWQVENSVWRNVHAH